jgi:hypothetical protein
MAGGAGYFWAGVALRVDGMRNGLKIAIRAMGGSALFLIVYFNPPFRDSTVLSARIHLKRICGQDVLRAANPLTVGPVCTIQGEIRGLVEPGSELCIDVNRDGEQSSPTCSPVAAGPFSIGGVVIREAGSPIATSAVVSAVLSESGEALEATAQPAAIPVVTPAPEARVDHISAAGGFTVSGTAAGLLDGDQLAIRVEDAEKTQTGAAYLYPENPGAQWTAHDRGDAKVPSAHAYRLTLFVGPRSESARSFRTLPERFREIGKPSIVKTDEVAEVSTPTTKKTPLSGGTR